MAKVELAPIKRIHATVHIRSTTPLIMHKWSEKAKAMMRDKQQRGTKTKARELKDPEADATAATYMTTEGDIGLPAMAFKNALITAAHKDIGIEKTLVRKALFLRCPDRNMVIPFSEHEDPTIREDMVRVGMGSADLRYRPEFGFWSASIDLEIDGDLLQAKDVLALINRAGFGVGICEWRPEKDGEYGRFEIDTDKPFEYQEA